MGKLFSYDGEDKVVFCVPARRLEFS